MYIPKSWGFFKQQKNMFIEVLPTIYKFILKGDYI